MEYIHKLMSINDNNVARFTMDIQISDNRIKTSEGYLHCKNVIMGRTGWQKYYGRELGDLGFNATEIVDVFRDESEVFHEITLDSAIGKPVTNQHPDVDVTVRNVKQLGKGFILGRPVRVGDDLVGEIMITDEELVYLVETNQVRELSLGYKSRLVRDGNHVLQKDIHINHLAVVDAGRAGNAMIVDEKTVQPKEDNVLDKLKEKGITININLNDLLNDKEEEVKVDDKEETKVEEQEQPTNQNEKDLDKDKVNDEDEEKVNDEDEEEKEKLDDEDKDEDKKENKIEDKGDVKDMELKELMKQMATMSDAEKNELKTILGFNDEKPTDIKDAKPNAFANNAQVSNGVTQDVKDYSHIQGDEKERAMQKFHDDNFSFDALVKKSNGDSREVKKALYQSKGMTSKKLLGGNR